MFFMRTTAAWCAALSLALVGCGDITDSVGEQGRLRFSLLTSYDVEEGELTRATIVAGHRQLLEVDLTSKGEDDIGEPDEITYRVSPREATEVETLAGSSANPPDLELLVRERGRYEVEAIYKGRVVDSIELRFDVPDALELSVKVREPYAEDFRAARASGGVIQVVEGAQATFLPIPKKGGRRLAGRIATEVSASPKALVVPGMGASFVYEEDVWSAEGSVDFYFIDPGRVTITLADPLSGAEGSYLFEVADAE